MIPSGRSRRNNDVTISYEGCAVVLLVRKAREWDANENDVSFHEKQSSV